MRIDSHREEPNDSVLFGSRVGYGNSYFRHEDLYRRIKPEFGGKAKIKRDTGGCRMGDLCSQVDQWCGG